MSIFCHSRSRLALRIFIRSCSRQMVGGGSASGGGGTVSVCVSRSIVGEGGGVVCDVGNSKLVFGEGCSDSGGSRDVEGCDSG